MIKIKTKNYKSKPLIAYMTELKEATFNETLKSVKHEFDKIFKDYKCSEHDKQSKGTITISVNASNDKLKYDLTDFCCENFKKEINSNLKK
ncbi:hypothetical protein [Seonamhaeicola sp. ML3]|uniref:hypothetical protein n=1 Tax=Seonamhaeicola sp. ML3 TaxID=2937786 RepID=UPI00200C1C88|nr:hypothetical protein [Seonamhaeicola sp. ML3]